MASVALVISTCGRPLHLRLVSMLVFHFSHSIAAVFGAALTNYGQALLTSQSLSSHERTWNPAARASVQRPFIRDSQEVSVGISAALLYAPSSKVCDNTSEASEKKLPESRSGSSPFCSPLFNPKASCICKNRAKARVGQAKGPEPFANGSLERQWAPR